MLNSLLHDNENVHSLSCQLEKCWRQHLTFVHVLLTLSSFCKLHNNLRDRQDCRWERILQAKLFTAWNSSIFKLSCSYVRMSHWPTDPLIYDIGKKIIYANSTSTIIAYNTQFKKISYIIFLNSDGWTANLFIRWDISNNISLPHYK